MSLFIPDTSPSVLGGGSKPNPLRARNMFRNLIVGATPGALPSPPARGSGMARRTFMASLALGPLVGGIVAWATLTAYAFLFPLSPGRFEFFWGWASLIILAIPVGYILGFVPSLLAGAINARLADTSIPSWARIVLAVPIGIATTWLVWFWLILGSASHNLAIYAAMFTAAGALGSPAAVWWANRPGRAGHVPRPKVPA